MEKSKWSERFLFACASLCALTSIAVILGLTGGNALVLISGAVFLACFGGLQRHLRKVAEFNDNFPGANVYRDSAK